MDNKENHLTHAALAWPILCNLAKTKRFIRYGILAPKINYKSPRSVRFALHLIQQFTITNNLPPLSILVVNAKKVPGKGFIACSETQIDKGIREVQNYDWSKIDNPFIL